MSSRDRRPYLTAASLTQDVLDNSQDNLTQQLEMIAEITAPDSSIIKVSDRAKYVGSSFYAPRVKFPIISRTVGDWLSGELEFSSLDLILNNTDKTYSPYLPGGASYDGWIGRKVVVKVGLFEQAATYTTIFEGFVTDVGGFRRDAITFTLICRNKFDSVNASLPQEVLVPDSYTDLEDSFVGRGVPVIYGDWTTDLREEAPSVPALPVNGANAGVLAGTTDLRLVLASTPISVFDDTSVTLYRGDTYYTFDAADITIVPATDNTEFDIEQQNLTVEGSPWIYAPGDEFYLKVKGVDLGAYDDNIVSQAKDILKRFGGLVDGDFDANWATYRDKATPAQSNIAAFKSRVWIGDDQKALAYALSMLEQVRLEAFVDRDSNFKLLALHFEDFVASPTFAIKNWDLERRGFNPQIDERNNWNRAKADFSYDPSKRESLFSTAIYKNSAAITQAGKEISKLITFPNLYDEDDVVYNLKEMIRLASAYSEMIPQTLSSRAFLKDIGDFVDLQVKIGSVEFGNGTGVPCMIREIGYDPDGLAIPSKLWSFQMVPFPGYAPGYAGITGGYNATITKET